ILTPPPSSVTPSTITNPLPHPRQRPLKSGGPKESALIRYLDEHILLAKRRWAKRRFDDGSAGDVKGYHSFKEAGKDIDSLIDVVWVSGTPSLQVPYLLNLALMVLDFLPGFAPSPKTTFKILDKLDLAFASLLQGHNIETGEALPGFEGGRGISTTEKVRMKSVVERTRVTVVDIMSVGDVHPDDGEEHMDTDEDDSMDEDENDVEGNLWEMDIAKVYEITIGELGDTLGGPPIGIVPDG
ncbi:hypothetical protein K432DRAFT_257551, partial [Lepidopterella palustris CBS 459.81]